MDMAPRRARSTPADLQQSFDELYRGHRAEVYRDVLRKLGNVHDAEDVTQAAFVDAYRAVLRGTRPEAPRAWLLAIAENVRRRRFRTSLRRPPEQPLPAETATAPDESHEQAQSLLDALATLTAEQREAFLLREIAGRSYEEIARLTDSTVASVQMLLFRARRTLRKELEPPEVHGVLVPLATLAGRFEGFGVAPRVAGAVGAAVLTFGVGAGVPVQAESTPHETRLPPAAAAEPVPVRPVASAQPSPFAAARPAGSHAARKPPAITAPPVVRASPPVRPAQPQPRPEPMVATPPQPRQPDPEPQPPLPVEPQALPTISISAPTISVPTISVPPLPEHGAEPLPDPVLENVAGAAGAAGAGAPPLPVLPPDPVPPVP
jgi:RNA polymerase sigma-70 factor, ECF subfamily